MPKEPKTPLQARLKYEADMRGLDPDEVAAQAGNGWSGAVVKKIVAGTHSPSFDEVMTFTDAFGVPIESLAPRSPRPMEVSVRLDEVPELQEHADDLAALQVRDVMVVPVEGDQPAVAAVAFVGYTQPATHWVVVRKDEGSVRAAVTALLRGLVEARHRALTIGEQSDRDGVEVGQSPEVMGAINRWEMRRNSG